MRLVFLYGPPACGKLTVGKELAAITGWKLFHNHLTVDLALSLFAFGTAEFVALRDKIWMEAFEAAAKADLPGMIFTFAPEPSVEGDFPEKVAAIVARTGGETTFVALTAPVEVLEYRLADVSRHAFGKLTDVNVFRSLAQAGTWTVDHMPATQLSVDTSEHTPAEAARLIAYALS